MRTRPSPELIRPSFTKYPDEHARPEPHMEEVKPVFLDRPFEIPRKPRTAAATPVTEVRADVFGSESTTGKRKREVEETEDQGPTKRVAGVLSTNGDGQHPIVLDESSGGAILVEDD